MKIETVKARQILDSRGNPTVEAEVYTKSGRGRAAVPSGASTGGKEAQELRDRDSKYDGKGVEKAVGNIRAVIAEKLIGRDVENQEEIDNVMRELDGTEKKCSLGANAILAVSLAVARCAANSLHIPLYRYLNRDAHLLPVPLFNIINGGAHASNKLEFQEFMVAPVGASRFKEALRMGAETYHELERILGGRQSLGDEGGFSPAMRTVREPLDAIMKAIENLGYEKKMKIALDCAPSYFYDEEEGRYSLEGRSLTSDELIDVYEALVKTYPIISIEDPMYEEDESGFERVTKTLERLEKEKVMVVGDDLFVTSSELLRRGIDQGMCNALLLKVNQVGTLSEAMDAARLAIENDYKVIVSHRSGETEDTFISHLAVALNCGWIKAGAPARGERTAKYNELLRIEECLGEEGRYGRD